VIRSTSSSVSSFSFKAADRIFRRSESPYCFIEADIVAADDPDRSW
jgi:hypothetical protein